MSGILGSCNDHHGQLSDLDYRIQAFVQCVWSLPDALFLTNLDNLWAPRDIVAHLIGWNRYTVQGCQQLMKGETPSYLVDPGNDFSKVNAVSVQRYRSNSRSALVNELEASTGELRLFILSLGPAEWETDYGVRWRGGTVTIKNTVDGLIRDYVIHTRQIEKWVEREKSLTEDRER